MKKSNNFCKINITSTLIVMILFMVGLMSIFTYSLAQNSPWTLKTNMPTARMYLSTSVVNGKIYATGGCTSNGIPFNAVEQYDPATDTWTPRIPIPTARFALASSAVNGKIYVFGGNPGKGELAYSTVEEYDPVTDTWTTKVDMPTARSFLSTSVVNGKIYVIGGAPSSKHNSLNTVEMYDPVTDSWATKTPMPTARMLHSAAVVNDKIYVIGGVPNTSSDMGYKTVEMYDPSTDSWTAKTDMSTARTTFSTVIAVNNIIYVCGGSPDHSTSIATVEAYDPATDTWSIKTSMPSARALFSTSMVNGKIYAIGGTVGDPWIGISRVEEYDPTKDLAALIDHFSLDKYFVVPESDICITTKINDPTGVTLLTKIQAPDQTTIDSLQLFDDGNHNDKNAGDGLFANVWPFISAEEQSYYIDLQVTKTDTDTIVQCMDNMALFTTVGPLVFEGLTFGSSDNEPNPGDEITFKITLKNNDSTASVTNVTVKLLSLDTLITVINNNRPCRDIEAGSSMTSNYFKVKISEYCPDSTEIQFAMDITSNDYTFWKDTCSILVVEPTTGINLNENTPRQFILDQNYPNPFNPKTVIGYSLPVTCEVELSVYNILGQKVSTLVNKQQNAGSYKVNFDASKLSNGTYFYKLLAGKFKETKKMLLLK